MHSKAEVFPLSPPPCGLKPAPWRETGHLDLWYEGHDRIISTHLAFWSDLSNVSAESRTRQVWYQVLNLWGLSLFQSRQTQLNNHYCLLCVCSWNLHLLHTGLELRNLRYWRVWGLWTGVLEMKCSYFICLWDSKASGAQAKLINHWSEKGQARTNRIANVFKTKA